MKFKFNKLTMMVLAGMIILFSAYTSVFGQRLEQTIVNDSFAHKPFSFEITEKNLLAKLKVKYLRTSRPTKKGDNIPGDSLITWTFDHDEIDFIKQNGVSMFFGADIQGTKLSLSHGLRIGLSSAETAKALNVAKILGDVLIVTDSNEFCYHYFYFKDKTLVQLKIDGCSD